MTKINKEIWKQIPGFRDYEVSNFGNVRSWKSENRYNNKPKIKEPSIRKPYFCSWNRPRITLLKDKKYHARTIHRLVLLAFVGPCPKGMECCHYDGDPTNNHLSNLRWDTHKANRADSKRYGKHGMGTQSVNAKLTEPKAKRIRQFFECGFNYDELADTFKVSPSTIARIVTGKSWRHVGGPIINSGRGNRKHKYPNLLVSV